MVGLILFDVTGWQPGFPTLPFHIRVQLPLQHLVVLGIAFVLLADLEPLHQELSATTHPLRESLSHTHAAHRATPLTFGCSSLTLVPMKAFLLILVLVLGGCATVEDPYTETWTPERKAMARSMNQLGRAHVGPPPTIQPLPPPLYCNSAVIGTSVTTNCY